jgi:membrane-bound inhibitor of C-type lysozyme
MLVAAAGIAVVFAAPAHADPEQDFLNMLTQFGDFSMGPWDNNVIFLPKGHQVCADLQTPGVTPESEAQSIVQNNLIPPWTELEARQFVAAAQLTLCPDVNQNMHAPVFYRCDNQPQLSSVFYNGLHPSMALLTWNGDQVIVYQQPMGSGIRYSGNGVEYNEHQGHVDVNFRGTQLTCSLPPP